MNFTTMRRTLCLLLLLAATGTRAADREMTVITLNYAEPASVVTALQGIIGDDGTVRAIGHRLVVRTTPDRLAEIRRVIANLDREPRTLLISVRTSAARDNAGESYGIGGQWGDDSTRIVVNRNGSHTETHTRVTLNRRDSNRRDEGSRTVTALEGHSAYISIGEAFPQASYAVGPYGETRVERDYVPVRRGFTVNVRVHDDQVLVVLEYRDDRRGRSGTTYTNTAATQFSAPLGQWFAVSSVNESSDRSEHVILGSSVTGSERSNRIWLKVELAR